MKIEELRCEHQMEDGTLCGEFGAFGFMDYQQERRICFCVNHVKEHTKEMIDKLQYQKKLGLW